MSLVIMNAPIFTLAGDYCVQEITTAEAIDVTRQSKDVISAVGHASTADILTDVLGVPVPVNRIEYKNDVNDLVLCFKLNTRAPEGTILSSAEIDEIGYTFFLVSYLGTHPLDSEAASG